MLFMTYERQMKNEKGLWAPAGVERFAVRTAVLELAIRAVEAWEKECPMTAADWVGGRGAPTRLVLAGEPWQAPLPREAAMAAGFVVVEIDGTPVSDSVADFMSTARNVTRTGREGPAEPEQNPEHRTFLLAMATLMSEHKASIRAADCRPALYVIDIGGVEIPLGSEISGASMRFATRSSL